MAVKKKRVLLIGSGGIGTLTALNLELSGECAVTAVLRSNYNAVREKGFQIDAIDYGKIDSWRPTEVRNSVPDVAHDKAQADEYEYVICTTKNTPDVQPSLVELIRPAVTPGRSVIVLIQNGINIEKPLLEAFPRNIVLSGISRMGAYELRPGYILQDDPDRLGIGPFDNPNLTPSVQKEAAEEFVRLYSASGKATCTYDDNLQYARWNKLLYNCVYNPICALTDCDTGRLRLVGLNENYANADPVELLIRPAIKEVIAVAKSVGVTLEPELIDSIIESEPVETFCVPSMLQDTRKERPIEVENILGEVVRTADKNQVPVPVVKVLFALLIARQWRALEKRGTIDAPAEAEKRKKQASVKL